MTGDAKAPELSVPAALLAIHELADGNELGSDFIGEVCNLLERAGLPVGDPSDGPACREVPDAIAAAEVLPELAAGVLAWWDTGDHANTDLPVEALRRGVRPMLGHDRAFGSLCADPDGTGCCAECGVGLEQCDTCRGLGYHRPGCPDSDARS